MATSQLDVVLGCMTFGEEGTSGARVHDLKDVGAIIDVFTSHGHKECDTALSYCKGTSEEYMGKVGWQDRGLVMDTKLFPNRKAEYGEVITHEPADLRKFLTRQLAALKTNKLHLWYLHAPDRGVDYEVTLKAVDELFKERLFERFGVSNYPAWEVAYMCSLCEKNGWVKPTAYQGIYNAVHRSVEAELFPCLRKFGLQFYEFNPLAGGFFTGQYKKDAKVEAGSRFDDAGSQGKNYRQRYWNDAYFEALEIVKPVAEKHGLTLSECALRWVSHHSLMKKEKGDKVLIGASSLNHIEQNLLDLEKGPLPDEVCKALDEAWEHVKPVASCYFR